MFPIKYNPRNRGIAVRNLHARILPTTDPYFHHFSIPGEGYPFDNLQESAVWVGTPVYIIGKTLDQQWCLVLTPQFIAWVQSDGVGKTSEGFIAKWQKYAKRKMVATTRIDVSVFDNKGQYRFNTYIGTVFPGKDNYQNNINILIPVVDTQNIAKIVDAKLSNKNATTMPLKATPHNFVTVMSSLLGRAYGWDSMYFYNDCATEIKNFYTPFGIWLPTFSIQQLNAGRRMVDKSSVNMQERLKYLMENGKKFTTIVHTVKHVAIYIGNYPNSSSHELVPMTYQNAWKLKPIDNSYRAVLGQSLLFPLLATYPEDPRLNPQANEAEFQLIYLD